MKTDTITNQHLCLECKNLQSVEEKECLRCNSKISYRKKESLSFTFVLTISAMFFLIPANMLVMMDMISLGNHDANTIISGVIYFFNSGEYFVGSVIFIASIVVPFYKVSVLLFVLWVAKFEKYRYSMRAMKLFRSIEFVGKWSMLDIFVVAMMVGIVQLGNLVTIEAGGAAFAFMCAVLFTMAAVETFDTRLLWSQE